MTQPLPQPAPVTFFDAIVFGVITQVPDGGNWGNLACDLDIFQVVEGRSAETDWHEVVEPVPPLVALNLRTPVFHVGEVLIMDGDGREIPYPQRKPSKWLVTCEQFTDLDEALTRARQVVAL